MGLWPIKKKVNGFQSPPKSAVPRLDEILRGWGFSGEMLDARFEEYTAGGGEDLLYGQFLVSKGELTPAQLEMALLKQEKVTSGKVPIKEVIALHRKVRQRVQDELGSLNISLKVANGG